MNEIACRNLIAKTDETITKFSISIYQPVYGDDDYFCEIYSQDMLFKGIRKVHGVDSIDAIDYAIQFIDNMIDKMADITVLWEDGSAYSRRTSSIKMDWG